MKRGYLFAIAICLLLAGSIVVFSDTPQKNLNTSIKPSIVTSFYPLFYFTKEIAGNTATVINLTPAGAEPHDYELNTQDIAAITKSQLLIINGGGVENWQDKIIQELQQKNIPILIASDGLRSQSGDPHVWLDPILAKEEVEAISNQLITINPTNTAVYRENAAVLNKKLEQLDSQFKTALTNCKQENIITSHEAFGYIAVRYGFNQIAIAGISPDQEPSPQTLANISKLAKETNIHFIFFETLLSPRLAETIAKEAQATTLVLNPLEGLTDEEQQTGINYFSVQQENIKNLSTALECNL